MFLSMADSPTCLRKVDVRTEDVRLRAGYQVSRVDLVLPVPL